MTFEQEFRTRSQTVDIWQTTDIDWKILENISHHFEELRQKLESTALALADYLQKDPSVHSVRWRIKNCDHLIDKIIRKKSEKNKKYLNISADNFANIVTDLIGLRALHLFKDDGRKIHERLCLNYSFAEKPVLNMRVGDSELTDYDNIKIKYHTAGYRSAHYILKVGFQKKPVIAELQVRTIFEEGWSEIDHIIRYPNGTDQLQSELLSILNRLAGNADELGSFVQQLSVAQKEQALETKRLELEAERLDNERKDAINKLEKLIKNRNENKSSENIDGLMEQISKVKELELPAAIRFTKTNDSFGFAKINAAISAMERGSAIAQIEKAINSELKASLMVEEAIKSEAKASEIIREALKNETRASEIIKNALNSNISAAAIVNGAFRSVL